jgi:hypothetical protein
MRPVVGARDAQDAQDSFDWPDALGEMEAVEQQARDVSDDRQAERRCGGNSSVSDSPA